MIQPATDPLLSALRTRRHRVTPQRLALELMEELGLVRRLATMVVSGVCARCAGEP